MPAGPVGMTQLRAQDLARAAARELARGEPCDAVIRATRERAGQANIEVFDENGFARVSVTLNTGAFVKTLVSMVSAEVSVRQESQ